MLRLRNKRDIEIGSINIPIDRTTRLSKNRPVEYMPFKRGAEQKAKEKIAKIYIKGDLSNFLI